MLALRIRQLPILIPTLFLTACGGPLVDVDLYVVGEQTALEKQVLGTYSSLGENLMVYSSVRGVDEDGSLKTPPPATNSQQAAFTAMRNREYNRDDIESLLVAGMVGESNAGMLVFRDESIQVEGLTPDQIKSLVAEENSDRQAILQRLIDTIPSVDDSRRAEVAWIFAGLNHDTAPIGSWLQNQDDAWRQK